MEESFGSMVWPLIGSMDCEQADGINATPSKHNTHIIFKSCLMIMRHSLA